MEACLRSCWATEGSFRRQLAMFGELQISFKCLLFSLLLISFQEQKVLKGFLDPCVCARISPHQQVILRQQQSVGIQFNSDIIYPEIEADSTGKGLGPTRPPSLQTPIQAQVVSCASD